MSRLIDADLLKQNCKCTGKFEDNFMCVDLVTLAEVIDAQPTACDAESRNKVIEEFASALTNKDNMLEHDIDEIMMSFHSYDLACNYFREYVDYVAEQLKGGAE